MKWFQHKKQIPLSQIKKGDKVLRIHENGDSSPVVVLQVESKFDGVKLVRYQIIVIEDGGRFDSRTGMMIRSPWNEIIAPIKQ